MRLTIENDVFIDFIRKQVRVRAAQQLRELVEIVNRED